MAKRVLTLLVAVVFSMLLAEGVLRSAFADRFWLPLDERSLTYRHDGTLGWFPIAGSERTIQGTRPFRVRHNERGFRDSPHGEKSRPRILVLGDSFVWGFDVERRERFTQYLQSRIEGWEVLNLGVSGYGTDQALILLQREIGFYRPEIVVLVFAEENDRDDNRHSRRYGGYYKPYFRLSDDGLVQRGVPVPPSLPYLRGEHPFLFRSYLVRAAVQGWLELHHPVVEVPDPSEALVLAVRDLTREHGAHFALGIQGRERRLLGFARAQGIPAVHLANRHRYRHFGGHWTPKGHALVAERLHRLLGEQGWLR